MQFNLQLAEFLWRRSQPDVNFAVFLEGVKKVYPLQNSVCEWSSSDLPEIVLQNHEQCIVRDDKLVILSDQETTCLSISTRVRKSNPPHLLIKQERFAEVFNLLLMMMMWCSTS